MSIYKDLKDRRKKLAVIGLGYVGLPLALEFAKSFDVIGFDINSSRLEKMKLGIDPSKELDPTNFHDRSIVFTSNIEDLKKASFYIVALPTGINESKVPDLAPLLTASKTVGHVISKGDYVIFESTVYPGCTEDDCVPEIEKESGLLRDHDFHIGYSPERIVPGDKVRTLTKIKKIVAANSPEILDEIAEVYDHIIDAGIHKAESIKVGEAAKVIENTQRDLNISLMNELALIFDKMGLDTQEILKAAGTKWNFLPFFPGLVGGHCIGIDPYYLIHKSKQIGIDPQVIAAGRRINDGMPSFIAKRLAQLLIENGKNPGESKVLVKGITFKENVADIRNSKVVDFINELRGYSLTVDIVDEHASIKEVKKEYNLDLIEKESNDYDVVVVAVAHKEYMKHDVSYFENIMVDKPILFDVKSIYDKNEMKKNLIYWNL